MTKAEFDDRSGLADHCCGVLVCAEGSGLQLETLDTGACPELTGEQLVGTGDQSAWLCNFQPRVNARVRLFCFPFAGGSAAAFRTWSSLLSSTIDVQAIQLPARATRLRDTPVDRMDVIVDQLVPSLAPYLDRPYAFFGHSMGALLAFEVARRLESEDVRPPDHVIVSSRRAPHLRHSESLLHPLPDDEFVREINRRYGGIPPEVAQHPDVLELLLPALRADIAALETYRPETARPLRCPITALGGLDDPRVSREDLDAWRAQTFSRFESRLFPGGHFYLSDPRSGLLSEVSDALSRIAASPQDYAA